jgi:response regulator RpfG family c-di-GMP phosphodiesterase
VHAHSRRPLRVLVVDDDPGVRALLRTTLELELIEVVEAESAAQATSEIDRERPGAIVLDVGMPVVDGVTLCRGLKADPATRDIPVLLLSGLADPAQAANAGADAYLRKPFSPLELVGLVQRLAGSKALPLHEATQQATRDQLLAYAADLRIVMEDGLRQQALLQSAYRQTVQALALALESKDTATRAHSQRVVSYATELTLVMAPELLDDPSLEYGFLLHDIGKIGVPDQVLNKPGPLTPAERQEMQRHATLGASMLANVRLLDGAGLDVVRSHHERWDGRGYPEGLTGRQTPLSARIFSVADALDAMTSDRPYRARCSWEGAANAIAANAGSQFDPAVVEALGECGDRLRDFHAAALSS